MITDSNQSTFSSSQDEEAQEQKNKITRITIIIPTDAYFLSGLRDFTLSLTKNMTGFSDQWAYRFQAVVDELCNNAIEYGSFKDSDIKIVFKSNRGEYIEVMVEDTGTGHVKTTAQQLSRLVLDRSNPGYLENVGVRGRGLVQIVASWSDELEFQDKKGGGIIVRVRKYLHKNGSGEKSDLKTSLSNPILKASIVTPVSY